MHVQRLRGLRVGDDGAAAVAEAPLISAASTAGAILELLTAEGGGTLAPLLCASAALCFMVLNTLVEAVCDPVAAQVRDGASEELCVSCIASVRAVALAVRGGSARVAADVAPPSSPALAELRSVARLPSLGFAVSVLLDAASGRAVRVRACQLAALAALRSLSHCTGRSTGGGADDDGDGDVAGPSLLWRFLPGISTALFRIVLSPRANQSSAVVAAAVETWGVAISCAVSDRACAALLPRATARAASNASRAAPRMVCGSI